MIKDDLELVVHKFPLEMGEMHIYPIGDTQYGSAGFDEELYEKWAKRVEDDPYSYVVFVGDMVNNGLKNSRTNVYREVKSPQEQKDWLEHQVDRFKEMTLGGIAGNHELRTVEAVGTCPMYDGMKMWGLEDYYRENMLFMKVNFGNKGGGRQCSYTIALHHGGSENKIKNFSYSLDGVDALITGHIHQPSSHFPAKFVVDSHNEKVRKVGFKRMVVPSFDTAGYSMRGAFLPQSSNNVPVMVLHGGRKAVDVCWIEI